MPVEDFTSYTEEDPNNHIDLVGTNHIDFYAIKNEDAWLVKDMGAGHFIDFEHKIDVRLITGTYAHMGGFWMLSNAVDDELGLRNSDETHIVIYTRSPNGNVVRMTMLEWYNGNYYLAEDIDRAVNTWYYLTIKKDGINLTCTIYSDPARTNLLNTLSLTLHADHNFRYVFAAVTYNNGQTYADDLDVENLDLQEVPPPGLPAPTKTTLTLTL